jgi:hypothetical protein
MQPALVNGVAGAVSTRDGEPFSVGGTTVWGGKIVAIDILADPKRLQLNLTILDNYLWPRSATWPMTTFPLAWCPSM